MQPSALVTCGRGAARQCDQMGLARPVQNAPLRFSCAFIMQGGLQAAVTETLTDAADRDGRDAHGGRDVAVSPGALLLSGIGEEQDAGTSTLIGRVSLRGAEA